MVPFRLSLLFIDAVIDSVMADFVIAIIAFVITIIIKRISVLVWMFCYFLQLFIFVILLWHNPSHCSIYRYCYY